MVTGKIQDDNMKDDSIGVGRYGRIIMKLVDYIVRECVGAVAGEATADVGFFGYCRIRDECVCSQGQLVGDATAAELDSWYARPPLRR